MCDLASGPPGDGRPALQVPLPPPGAVHEPVGCLECRETGYLGRVGAYEILSVDEPLRAALRVSAEMRALVELLLERDALWAALDD